MNWVAFCITFIFSAVGLTAAWLAQKVLKIENSTLFGSLFFAPILAYFVFSGQISEVKGFGMEVKFREVATKKIEIKAESILPALSGKKHGELQSFFAGGSEVVVLNADKAEKYRENPLPLAFRIAEQISANLLQGKFELLVVVDDQDRLIGTFAKSWFMDIPSIPDVHVSRGHDRDFDQTDEKRIRRNLSKTLLWDILLAPRERTKNWGSSVTIKETASQLETFRTLIQHRVEALPVVNAEGKYKGIIRQSDIAVALLEPLLETAASRKI
jgi:CBS domain-containing protein